MGLKTIVKVGGITNLSDARYCAGMGVEMLGFTIDPENSNHVTPETFKEITGWISGVDLVVETNALHLHDLEGYSFSYIQVNDASLLSKVIETGSKAILSVDIDDFSLNDLNSLGKATSEIVAYYLFEKTPGDLPGGIGIINSFAEQYPVLLGFDVSVETLYKILSTPVKGIAMHGTVEDKPGLKTYDELADILEYLEEE